MKPLNIVHINFTDRGGGAAVIMNELIAAQLKAGHNAIAMCARPYLPASGYLGIGFQSKAGLSFKLINMAAAWRNRVFGDTHAYAWRVILEKLKATKADVFHIHNIHGGWFPLDILDRLSKVAPVVWTLHDEWAYTGHCVATLGCERFLQGCGECPHLNVMVPLLRDTSRENWLARSEIYGKLSKDSCLVAVSNWVADRVRKSGVWPAHLHVVHNGVNTDIFNRLSRKKARQRLGMNTSSKILLLSAAGGVNNPFKNIPLALAALEIVKSRIDLEIIILGGKKSEKIPLLSDSNVTSIGHVGDRSLLCDYYVASDLLVYPTSADTFGLVVAEAMSCGTPVLATAVGGVQELIEDGVSGFLVPDKISSSDLAERIITVLGDPVSCARVGRNAMHRIRESFNTNKMSQGYFQLYQKIVRRTLN